MAMTKKQDNKRSMFGAVVATLNANNETIGSVTALVNAKNDFEKLVNEIDQKSIEKGAATKGNRLKKDAAKKDLVDAVVKISGVLVAFANRSENVDLKSRAKTTPSELRHLRENELTNRATEMHGLAVEVIDTLSDYGITAETLTDLNDKINTFSEAIQSKDSGLADRSAARQALIGLFEQADALLKNELDQLMELIKVSNPACYNAYYAARVIKDLGLGRQSKTESEDSGEN